MDNILGISNVVNPQDINKHNPAKLGGAFSHNYQYDELNRLIHASGKAKRASYDMVMSFGRMSEPLTKVQKVDSTTTAKSYNFAYKYEDSNHPTAPTQIGHDHYTYDANGNPVLVTNDSTNTTREMYWDEDNRLMVLSDNGKTSRYTYNAAGERIMKSYGTMEGVYINGAPQGITFHETDNFTLYPASILSVNKNRFTKHYFLGDKRVASRIGTGLFNNVYGRNGSYVTAGQQDYAERMNQIQTQKEAYYKKVGVAPGVPTEKGAYGDPENTGVGYNAVLTELGNHDVPQGWIQTPHPNTTPNTNPGPPVSWNDPSNPDDPQAGYGYIANDTTKEETFFYHSDHLGSTSYITDDKANITQYDAYLPYGELLVDEHSSSEDLPYKFNGKQFDEETGLYYYGARYMNPVASIWYGVDNLAEDFTNIAAYVYCNNNPIRLKDPDGNIPLETIWDAANVLLGVANLTNNINRGRYGAAALDGVGIILDAAATVLPYIPGGVASGLKALRAGKTVEHVTQISEKITRRAAFRAAKRDAGFPMSQHPIRVTKVPMSKSNGKSILGKDGKPIMTREYHNKGSHGDAVIQEHSVGHQQFRDDAGKPHFNIRRKEYTRKGTYPGTKNIIFLTINKQWILHYLKIQQAYLLYIRTLCLLLRK